MVRVRGRVRDRVRDRVRVRVGVQGEGEGEGEGQAYPVKQPSSSTRCALERRTSIWSSRPCCAPLIMCAPLGISRSVSSRSASTAGGSGVHRRSASEVCCCCAQQETARSVAERQRPRPSRVRRTTGWEEATPNRQESSTDIDGTTRSTDACGSAEMAGVGRKGGTLRLQNQNIVIPTTLS